MANKELNFKTLQAAVRVNIESYLKLLSYGCYAYLFLFVVDTPYQVSPNKLRY